jgi:transposase
VTQENYTSKEAAKSLGIPEGTLVYWLRRRRPADQPFELPGEPTACGDAAAGDPKALAIQVRDLQAKVRRLEMEKEILKKATAFFAREQP